jgi:tRNA threonylcarbamoyladenosine biosynthesis protein TsaB
VSILALDTATEACSAAVLLAAGPAGGSPAGSLVCRYEEPGRGHAERILSMVDAVLAESGLTLRGLDAIAFGRGPGAFTGVRLAASVAQGLAFAAGLPVVPVSDLRALAQRALEASPEAQAVLVCADARMREVYWSCFVRGVGGLAEPYPGLAERVGPATEVELPAGLTGRLCAAGRGFRVYPQLGAQLAGRALAVYADLLPRASEIARLAAADFAAGIAVTAEEAVPVYLRDDVARPAPSRDCHDPPL